MTNLPHCQSDAYRLTKVSTNVMHWTSNKSRKTICCPNQGCQMVYFQTKDSNLGKSWRALDGKMLIYFMAIWNILSTFGKYFMTI
jgi:hypothetical protein